MTNSLNELVDGERVARNVTIVTFLLALGKFAVAFLTNSVVILADSFHSFSDIVPIMAAWFGLKIAQKPESEKFPFGYYRAENLAALFASLFILFLGFEIISESLNRLISGTSKVSNDLIGISMIVIATLTSYFLYNYQFRAAKRTRSQALMANATETKMDIFSAFLVLFGFLSSIFRIPYVEGAVGIILSIFVFYAGYENLHSSVLSLMDAGVSREDVERIKNAALSVSRVKGVKEVKARHSGPFLMVELVILVSEGLSIDMAHKIADDVEKKIRSLDMVDHVIVHVEPEKSELLVARPVNEDGSFARVFGSAPYFDIFLISEGKRKKVERMKNPGFGLAKKRGVKAALSLIERGVDMVEVKNIGEDSQKILEDAGVKVRIMEG